MLDGKEEGKKVKAEIDLDLLGFMMEGRKKKKEIQFILLCVYISEIKYLIKSQRNSNRSRLAVE